MKINSIILAAGMGSRMNIDSPKCSIELLNKPMIEYIVDSFNESIVEETIVVTGYKEEVIRKILGDRVIFLNQKHQLGTADAVNVAVDYLLDGISIIVPGDVPMINKEIINNIIKEHIDSKSEITIGAITVEDPSGYGRIIGKVIVEDNECSEDEKLVKVVNSGIIVVNNQFLKDNINKITNNNSKNEYYITDIIKFTNNVNLFHISDVDSVIGINDLFQLSKAESILQSRINKFHMLNGVKLINPSSIVISSDVKIDKGTTIYPNTLIYGSSIIDKNVVIMPNTVICNSIIKDNSIINSSYIFDSKIGTNTTIGPYANIRENCIIGNHNRIGNFVEMKKTTTGNFTKACHLSYLGDSDIGNNVNIGCGSITVNYDGVQKYKSKIDDNVFIGCNSNLIAPIKIGESSFIAAGTTVTDDVEMNSFVISRVKQVCKKNIK